MIINDYSILLITIDDYCDYFIDYYFIIDNY